VTWIWPRRSIPQLTLSLSRARSAEERWTLLVLAPA